MVRFIVVFSYMCEESYVRFILLKVLKFYAISLRLFISKNNCNAHRIGERNTEF